MDPVEDRTLQTVKVQIIYCHRSFQAKAQSYKDKSSSKVLCFHYFLFINAVQHFKINKILTLTHQAQQQTHKQSSHIVHSTATA